MLEGQQSRGKTAGAASGSALAAEDLRVARLAATTTRGSGADEHAQFATRAALLFCLTPANVHQSAAYTEALFTLLAFAAALCLCSAFDAPRAAAAAQRRRRSFAAKLLYSSLASILIATATLSKKKCRF